MSICLSNKDDCSWHMPRCGHMFHDKCIQTWKASCKSEPSYEVCPQCRKPFRKFLSFYKQRGRSHARILRPSSSHKLDIILIALELPVSIYFETVIHLRVRSSIRIHLISSPFILHMPISFSSTCAQQFRLGFSFKITHYQRKF